MDICRAGWQQRSDVQSAHQLILRHSGSQLGNVFVTQASLPSGGLAQLSCLHRAGGKLQANEDSLVFSLILQAAPG